MTLQLGTASHMADRCAFCRWKRRRVPVVLSLYRDVVSRWMRFFLFSPCESDTIASAMPIMGFIVFLVEEEVGVPCADLDKRRRPDGAAGDRAALGSQAPPANSLPGACQGKDSQRASSSSWGLACTTAHTLSFRSVQCANHRFTLVSELRLCNSWHTSVDWRRLWEFFQKTPLIPSAATIALRHVLLLLVLGIALGVYVCVSMLLCVLCLQVPVRGCHRCFIVAV